MIEKSLTAANVDNNEVRLLYETAFPPEEQIPWDDLMQLVDLMPLDFTAYYDGKQLLGFTIVYPRKSFNWFWYFAVPPHLRSAGVGQKILSQLIEKYKDCTNILDMESPEQVCENQNCVEQGEVTLENREKRILLNMVICLPHNLRLELVTREEAQRFLEEVLASEELAGDTGE